MLPRALTFVALLAFPIAAFAQEALTNVITEVLVLIDVYLVNFIFAVAFLLFIWGIYNYFIAGGANEEKRKEGRSFVIYGLVGFFIMFSLWGIVRVFTSSFGFEGQNRPPLPFEEEERDTGTEFPE